MKECQVDLDFGQTDRLLRSQYARPEEGWWCLFTHPQLADPPIPVLPDRPAGPRTAVPP